MVVIGRVAGAYTSQVVDVYVCRGYIERGEKGRGGEGVPAGHCRGRPVVIGVYKRVLASQGREIMWPRGTRGEAALRV
jgi:hypothetical protein